MKKSLSIYSALLAMVFCLGINVANAQNKPNTSTPGNGNTTIPNPTSVSLNTETDKFNFVRTYIPKYKYDTVGSFNNPGMCKMTTTYKNGWGQPIQFIDHYAGALTDVVTPYYNTPSLTQYAFLPYWVNSKSRYQSSPYTASSNYYSNMYASENGYFFSKSKVDISSSIITKKSFAPGNEFVGKHIGAASSNIFNVYSDNVVALLADVSWDLFVHSVYGDNEIVIKESTAPGNRLVKEYYNKDKQLVLKRVKADNSTWLQTYYVYNDLGKLVFILPPKAVEYLENNSWSSTAIATVIDKLCYKYKYDKLGNVIERHLPDRTGVEYTVYNRYNLPVLFRNPNLEQKGKWMFTVYDGLGREVLKGLINSTDSWSDWVGWLNGTLTPPQGPLVPSDRQFLYKINNDFDGMYNSNLVLRTGGSECEIIAKYYYDNYISGKSFYTGFGTDYIGGPDMEPSSPNLYTRGQMTESVTKIMDGNQNWVHNIYFYDDEGRPVQTQTKNPWNTQDQWDINSIQYNFLGQPVLEIAKYYTWTGCNVADVKIETYREYHINGKIKFVKQSINDGPARFLSSYVYDNIGRLELKTLGSVESQKYEYSIRGELTAINKYYVNNIAPSSNNTYGEILEYEKGFDKTRTDGNITGMIWRGSGTSPKRAYGYEYDYAGRLKGADFNVYSGSTWNKTNEDYTVSNVSYDANGNILTMKQRGVPKNNPTTPVDMDRLRYDYVPHTNKLQAVTDSVLINPDTTYYLPDFIDAYTGATDYEYDPNGNLRTDRNKGIDSIVYNFQDLPATIYTTKGTITNIYDADGVLIQKTIAETGKPTIVKRYWGACNYQNDSLQFFLHEEGRTRYLADSTQYRNDFFVKDHLGNVRSVVTADIVNWNESYLANHEIASAGIERLMFENVDSIRAPKPQGGPNDISAARLNASEQGHVVGTGIVLHVMAGDIFDLEAYGYYEEYEGPNEYLMPEAMMSAIVSAFSGGAEGGEGGPNPIIDGLFAPGNYLNVYDGIKNSATDANYPRTYVNYLLFDENMQIVAAQSGATQLRGLANSWNLINAADAVQVGQNGYLVAYISTENPRDSWIDKLSLTHYHGRLLEEQHYYPHGLYIEAGGQQNTPLPNDYLHQTKKLQRELGLELYDFHARQYDAQIGRFWGVDPADEFPSGYTGMGNDPANLIDPTGMFVEHVASGGSGGTSAVAGINTDYEDESNYSDWEYDPSGVPMPGEEQEGQGSGGAGGAAQPGDNESDTDSDEWVQTKDGTIKWDPDVTGTTDPDLKNGDEYMGEAVIVFDGSEDEKLGEGDNLLGKGAKLASVTVYGPKGENDIQTYDGYTMSSNPKKFGAIASGTYNFNYDARGKSGALKSNWAVEGRGAIPAYGGYNPNPNYTGSDRSIKTGIFIHTSNRNGYAGSYNNGRNAISEGCLLIVPTQWTNFNNQLGGVKHGTLQLNR